MEAEVEVQTPMAVAASMVAMVAMVVTSEAAVWEDGHQQLQRARRDDCVLWTDDGGGGSSWDRCGRCMAALPTPRRAGRRADGGWSRRCTTVGCCHLSLLTGGASTRHTQLTGQRGTVLLGHGSKDWQTTPCVSQRVGDSNRNSVVQWLSVFLRILPSQPAAAQHNAVLRASGVVH